MVCASKGRHSLNKGLDVRASGASSSAFSNGRLRSIRDNVDALVGLATTELATASSFMVDERGPILAATEARFEQDLCDGPASCHGSLAIGCLYILFTGPRPAGDCWKCEQALALDHNLAEAHAMMGFAKVIHWAGRGKRRSHPASAPAFSPRYARLSDGCTGLVSPNLSSAPMSRPLSGYVGALKPTAIILSHISSWQPHWRSLGSLEEARAAARTRVYP